MNYILSYSLFGFFLKNDQLNTEQVLENSPRPSDQVGDTAATGCTVGNLRVNDRENPREVTDWQLQNPTINAIIRSDKEGSDDYGIKESNVKSSANTEGTLESSHANHVDTPMQNGPTNQKPKPSWVRLRCMDCGPKEIEKAGTYIPLGKRVAT